MEALKLLSKLYEVLEKFPGVCLDWEGDVERLGDTVLMRPPVELFKSDAPISLMIDQKVDCNYYGYDEALRTVMDNLDWTNLKYFVAVVRGNTLMWGSK